MKKSINFVEEFDFSPEDAPVNIRASVRTDDLYGLENEIIVAFENENGDSEDVLRIAPDGTVTLIYVGHDNVLNIPVNTRTGKLKVSR